MPELELTYFDFKGRGELIRLILTIGNIPFKDKRVAIKEFPELSAKGSLPFGALPILTIDGKLVAQSGAIARYCGKLAGLYPRDDDLLALKIDEFLYGLEDAMAGARKSKSHEDRDAWVKTDVPRFFGALDALAKRNVNSDTWVCGSAVSTADIALYTTIGSIKDGVFDHVPTDTVGKYTRLMKSFSAVHEHPRVVEWNKRTPWKHFS